MIKVLLVLGIINQVSDYQVGIKSRTYSLSANPPVWESVVALPKFTLISSKIIAKRNLLRGNLNNDLKIYKYYVKNITVENSIDSKCESNEKKKFEFNHISTSSIFHASSSHTPYFSHYTTSTSSVPLILGDSYCNPIPVNGTSEFTTMFYNTEIINPVLLSLDAIRKGDWFIHRPDKRSRVHTNLTNLKREFRQLLRYDGKPFVELDIRNSQPLIATILIKNYWLKYFKSLPADVLKYQKDCEDGKFYDYFMELNKVAAESRGDFKAKIFGEVFFSKVSNRKIKLKNQFISIYPSAYEAICHIKGGLGSKTYNQFAILLQQKEASIIFDNVNMGLLRDGIPAFNIFDSILCLPEHKEIARERIMCAFAVHNIIPTINYKDYGKVS